ncbi:deoxyribose-phosphate aldolase [Paraburkholderia caballeronis]|uniref:Deoxyribose-phosphate aldolase n=1 Tax=Paraburkholderia caballeronis TaxID=416943 RepID=A0A1H7FZ54_9BURK|nr:deoxyribose-phosphate aldolase [Paraburkholderia caballeronis]PXW24778.1 deoxyribose-phosphate aldolase [Paraburkholderia caballeronis]PXX00508.1 deoxyribose-phosphate aldolase [Paraburkholderia caballeronis]RAJ98571.1 deoxyribose-phosphate aldolase [Paraburkholderia caballeronis]SEE67146.1 deoxyribose-phosphate aldolase [Paraburkholderia caballeronis]SEK31219.1 deoxyribose-phosphate aldolase [Paraburkholderia caballeronis]
MPQSPTQTPAVVALHRNAAGASARNPGTPFDVSLFDGVRVNASAVERRTATLATRRTLKQNPQAAWLLKAITCIDLTTLSGDDTEGRVRRLCAKARQPVRDDLLAALGMAPHDIRTGAVCVYHRFVAAAVDALAGSGIPVAAVSTGFPAGLNPHPLKLREIDASVADGASEIDIVVTREYVLTGNWRALYDEVREFRAACGDAHLKAILATGDIRTLTNVARASMVCMMAGADFIKTSTGKEGVNATLDVSLAMVRMIRAYEDATGQRVGFKPAGGVSSAKAVLGYQILMKEELGRAWLEPDLFRIGASSLLSDIERQLEHHVSGRYSAFHRHPAA